MADRHAAQYHTFPAKVIALFPASCAAHHAHTKETPVTSISKPESWSSSLLPGLSSRPPVWDTLAIRHRHCHPGARAGSLPAKDAYSADTGVRGKPLFFQAPFVAT